MTVVANRAGRSRPIAQVSASTQYGPCSRTVVQAVPAAANGVDQLARERLVDLGAQARDVSRRRWSWDRDGSPHPLEQHGARDDAALVAHQDFEQAELARLEIDLGAAADYLRLDRSRARSPTLGRVSSPLRCGRRASALSRARKLGEGKGFREISHRRPRRGHQRDRRRRRARSETRMGTLRPAARSVLTMARPSVPGSMRSMIFDLVLFHGPAYAAPRPS